ncbi:hypothetical protein DsansV1_C06g0060701 [Dioscorea sansibarensis]
MYCVFGNPFSQLYRELQSITLNTQTEEMSSVVELKRSLKDLKSSLAREQILGEQFDLLYVGGLGFARGLLTLYYKVAEKKTE